MPQLSLSDIQKFKNKKKIICLTAYTSSIAKIIDKYVDIILIGDSVGTAIYGMKNTRSVTLDMMKVHGRTVKNFSNKAYTIIDMPYGTYTNNQQALINACELLDYTKCQAVKLETDEKTIDIVTHLTRNKIKVVSHIGVNPQKYKNFDNIRFAGKDNKEKENIYLLAQKLQHANSSLIVLECMKADLAKKITNSLVIPTIGIGASIDCDGQVLVINDLLCIDNSLKKPRFIKQYAKLNTIIKNAVKEYCGEVINKKFPLKKNTY